MSIHAHRAPLVAAALVLLFGPTTLAAQAPAAGPFAKVPAFPTTCYTKGDPFDDKITAARDGVQAETYKQKEVNAKIEEDFNNIDPMEKANRMQQWMMSNPQEAMKFMQGQQQLGAETQTVGPEINDAAGKLETEKQQLAAKYDATLKQAWAPADARMNALNAKLGPTGCGIGDTECSPEPWAVAEYNAIQKQRDTAYQGVCAQYWSATGQAHGYLKRYRDFLTQKWVPSWQKTDDARLAQYAIMNTPAASWKSTIPHETAGKYMETARDLYSKRQFEPFCSAQGCR